MSSFSVSTSVDVGAAATALANEEPKAQMEFLIAFAKALSNREFAALQQECEGFAGEEESKLLCRLARAINERDAGLGPNDEVN